MGSAVQIWKNLPAKREIDYGLENALAKYVRNRWPEKTPAYVAAYFGLGESEALKVVYANASKNTLKKLLHHPRGGFGLFVELLAEATGTRLEDYIERRVQEARREAQRWQAEERRLSALAERAGDRSLLSRGHPERLGQAGPEASGLGDQATEAALDLPKDRRSFRGGER